jgi:hypothetical protein
MLLFVFGLTQAQLLDCATLTSSKQIQMENSFTDSVNQIIKLHRKFHLNVHVVNDNIGDAGIEQGLLESAMLPLNEAFKPIGITFKISDFFTIDNFNYNTIYYNKSDNELVDLSFIPNTINIYLVEKVYDEEGKITCSYAFLPADEKDIIFIQKDCFDPGRLIHLMGHVFNLYHTHEDAFGAEYADGSNCSVAGDLCCDTEAMMDITGLVDDDCEYAGMLKDENGAYYAPSTHNYMSFAPVHCRCFFSEEQYVRMINAIIKLKTHLW